MKTTAARTAVLISLLSAAGHSPAGQNPLPPSPDLYSEYESFIYALESKASSKALQHLSQKHSAELDANPQWEDFAHNLPILSTLDRMLPTTRSRFERIQHRTACLTVNGEDPGEEPTSVNIEFVQENNAWKMDYVQVVYHESIEDLPTAAVCPVRADD